MLLFDRRPSASPWLIAQVIVSACGLALSAQPQPSVEALSVEGTRAFNSGDFSRALDYFLSAARVAPRNTDLAFNLGLTYFRLGRFKEAVAPLRQAASVPEPAGKVLFLLGVALYQSGDLQGASTPLEVLNRKNSEHQDEVLYLLEECYRRGKQPSRAKQCFAELASKYPNSCFLHKLMGMAYSEQGRDDQALSELKQALALNSSITDVNRAIGIIYLNQRDGAEASGWFRREIALNPCDPASHYYLGEIARKNSQFLVAGNEYKKAIGCDAAYAEGHLGMGFVLEEQQQYTRALGEFREAARLDPGNVHAHYKLARALMRAGKTQEAKVEVKTVKRLQAVEDAKARAKLQ